MNDDQNALTRRVSAYADPFSWADTFGPLPISDRNRRIAAGTKLTPCETVILLWMLENALLTIADG